MKTLRIIFSLLAIMATSFIANAQTGNGVYLTAQDYQSKRINYPLDADKLQLNAFFEGKTIAFTSAGKRYKLNKADVFGYRLNGKDYRFFNRKAYAIVDTTGFYLYSRPELVQHYKGYVSADQYFFSVGNGKVQPLTLANISAAFPKNPEFRYAVQSYFNRDEQLSAYDAAQQTYKIKYIYESHLKPATTLNAD